MNNLIVKDAVIGFLVVRNYGFIRTIPLAHCWESADEFALNDPDDEIIAVLPAFPGCYQVWGELLNGEYKVLGYEFPGAHIPDWEAERQKRIKEGV